MEESNIYVIYDNLNKNYYKKVWMSHKLVPLVKATFFRTQSGAILSLMDSSFHKTYFDYAINCDIVGIEIDTNIGTFKEVSRVNMLEKYGKEKFSSSSWKKLS